MTSYQDRYRRVVEVTKSMLEYELSRAEIASMNERAEAEEIARTKARASEERKMIAGINEHLALRAEEIASGIDEIARLNKEIERLKMELGSDEKTENASENVDSRVTALGTSYLPPEVLVRIFRHLSAPSIGKARLVSRHWKEAVDANEAELWEARCRALNLLPDDAQTFLGWCAKVTLMRAGSIRRRGRYEGIEWARSELTAIFRAHYRTWVQQICRRCEPHDARSLNTCCTPPSNFAWVTELPYGTPNMRLNDAEWLRARRQDALTRRPLVRRVTWPYLTKTDGFKEEDIRPFVAYNMEDILDVYGDRPELRLKLKLLFFDRYSYR